MFKKINFYLACLIVLSITIYFRWLSFAPFVNSDWKFYFDKSLALNLFPSAWSTYFGGINLMLWRYPVNLIGGIFGILGLSSNVSEKFLYFWPIVILVPIGSFLLVRKITKSELAGFVGSLIFSFNTYFLSIDAVGHELLTNAYAWAVFAILSFIYLLETKKKIFIPFTALLLFIVGSYDFRSLYVTAGTVVFYALYHQLIIEKKWRTNLKINLLSSCLTGFILILLNLYWILSFMSAGTITDNAVLNRGIMSGSFYNLQNAIAFFYPFWTGAEPTWFFVQNTPFAFWLYPILAFFGLIVAKKNKQVVFFGLLAIVGIFLTKQDSAPFADVYKWFYVHIPGFNAFREATKFDFLIALSYAVLIGALGSFVWNYLKNRKYTKYAFVFLIILFPLWSTAPLLTGSIGAMFVPKDIPEDLTDINLYLTKQNKYSKVFWINRDSHWVISTNKHPLIDGSVNSIEDWEGRASINLDYLDLDSNQEFDNQKIFNFMKSDIGRRMLSLGSVGFVVLSEKGNDWTSIKSGAWRDLGNSLEKLGYLERLNIGTKSTFLFINKDQKPHVYLTLEEESLEKDIAYKNVSFKEINSDEYKINIVDINRPFYLNFSEYYNPNWNLYTSQFGWLNVLIDNQESIGNDRHFKNAAGFNSFYIDPDQVCKLIKPKVCEVNEDGTYNINLTLFFKPQAYLCFGLIISTVTLFGAIVAIGYFYKNKL